MSERKRRWRGGGGEWVWESCLLQPIINISWLAMAVFSAHTKIAQTWIHTPRGPTIVLTMNWCLQNWHFHLPLTSPVTSSLRGGSLGPYLSKCRLSTILWLKGESSSFYTYIITVTLVFPISTYADPVQLEWTPACRTESQVDVNDPLNYTIWLELSQMGLISLSFRPSSLEPSSLSCRDKFVASKIWR